MPTFNNTYPSGYVAKNQAATTGEASVTEYNVYVPITASGSNFGWQNPHNVPVVAYNVAVTWTTTGTGTIDVGTGTGGTGTNTAFIDGGTMNALSFANGAGGTLGTAGNSAAQVGASGSAGDSVVINHNEAATGTAVGAMSFTVRLTS